MEVAGWAVDTAYRATTREAAGIGSGGSTDGPIFIPGFVEEKPEVDGVVASEYNDVKMSWEMLVRFQEGEFVQATNVSRGYHPTC